MKNLQFFKKKWFRITHNRKGMADPNLPKRN